MNYQEFGPFHILKLKYRRINQIIWPFCKIAPLPQEIRFPLLNFREFSKYEKRTAESFRIQSNLMNDQEFRSLDFLKLKYKREDQMIHSFCRIGFPQEIRFLLLNLRKFSNYEKSTAESCRIQSNLMNQE